jgi:hypothetical protein
LISFALSALQENKLTNKIINEQKRNIRFIEKAFLLTNESDLLLHLD